MSLLLSTTDVCAAQRVGAYVPLRVATPIACRLLFQLVVVCSAFVARADTSTPMEAVTPMQAVTPASTNDVVRAPLTASPEPNVAPVMPPPISMSEFVGPPRPSHIELACHMPTKMVSCEARSAAVTRELLRHHHTLPKRQAMRAAKALCHEAERSHLDPLLLLAVIGVESSFNPQAISPVGAEGLMQLMPHTGQYLAARANLAWSQRIAFDPAINIRIGTRYLATLRDAFHGRMDWALTAYNRGPSATHHILREHHGLPRDVRASYASRVLGSYERLKKSYASAS